jgi:hypothetical protein
MDVAGHVRKAIDDWELEDSEPAMLHACIAVDGTARKAYPAFASKARFTRLLRENYGVLGPMGAPGIDLAQTRFPVPVPGATASGGEPDIADVIYGIHRCYQAHGEALPAGFELLHDVKGPARITRLEVERGKLRMSDRIIFGLLAVAVLSPVNADLTAPDGYYLTFGSHTVLPINDWWGRAADFPDIAAQDPVPLVKLDFGDWGSDEA